MPLTLKHADVDDPRIHTLVGACGHTIRSATVRYAEILAGERLWFECKQCQCNVQVFAFDPDKPRYCASEDCPHPDMPLSRYNIDQEQRCHACQLRDHEEWLRVLQTPLRGTQRNRMREVLERGKPLTAPAIEMRIGIPIATIYKHLTEMLASGEVAKLQGIRGGPTRYTLTSLLDSSDALAEAA